MSNMISLFAKGTSANKDLVSRLTNQLSA